jgi:CO/xanthine dehydrogenase Mo-binding subunit
MEVETRTGEAPPAEVIGRDQRRLDAPGKLTGRTRYAADLQMAGTAHVRLLLSPYASARIRAMDLEAARALPGVVAVVSGEDLPEVPATGPEAPLARGRVYFAGQPVVAAVAETEAIATDAIGLVDVDFEILPAAVSPEEALEDGAPSVLEGGSQGLGDAAAHGAAVGGGGLEAERRPNVTGTSSFKEGSTERALAEADVVVEGSYELPQVHQGFLEPHVALARYEPEGTYTVWTPTQGIFPTRQGIADALGLPLHEVRVVQTEVGGGFGGKVLLLEPLVALLARHTGRTVQLALTRTEEFMMGRGAPGYRIDLKLGARRDGFISALWARLRCDNGASPGGISGLSALMLASTYRVPDFDVTAIDVATHKTPVAAYRAPGAPQACFALESAIDEVARRLDMDPIELRLKNAPVEGDRLANGSRWPSIGFRECLLAAREHPLYTAPAAPDEGVGLAAGVWLGGLEPAAAACRVDSDGTVLVQTGHADISGTDTTLAMIAGEVLGVAPERVRIRHGDTETAPYAGMAGGSKTVYTVGQAVHEATIHARRQLLDIAAEELEADVRDLELRDGEVSVRGVPESGMPIGELAGLAARFGGRYRPVQGLGQSAQTNRSPMFTVQIARVRVDAATGRWELLQVAAIQDVGRALNPAEIRGQVHGGALQAMGRAIGEEMVWDGEGGHRSASLLEYGLPSIDQAPADFFVDLVEVASPYGPFGAKGVGEPPAVPGPAALANALRAATGKRLVRVPFSYPLLVDGEAAV